MKKRDSSIEMVRIIAMMFIIMGHLAAHGVLKVTGGNPCEIWRGGATLNKLFVILLMPGGRIGVALFFLISGYFQIRRFTVSIKKVVEETILYSIFLQIIAMVFKMGSLGGALKSLLPIASGNWWYVSSYVLLMLCSPVINGHFLKLSKKQKKITVVLVWVFLYTMPYLFSAQYYSLERGVLFYLLGAYIRTEVDVNKIRMFKPQLIVASILIWITYVPVGYLYYSGNNSRLFSIIGDGIVFNGLIVVSCAVVLFLVFVSANSYSNKTINTIAKSTFGIYLLHDNMYRNFIWDDLLKIPTRFQNPLFPIISIGTVVMIFISCLLIDYIRERLTTAAICRLNSKIRKSLQL